MSAEVSTVILPGGDPDQLEETLESVRAELGADAVIVDLSEIEAGSDDGILAFVRAGDRLVPGAFEFRLLTFENFPAAGISMAGYVLTGPDGEPVREVKPPSPGSRPDEMLLRRNVEAAAVLVRQPAMTAAHLDLLSRPLADVVVWSRIAREAGYQVSGEPAAFIRLDPDRHGQSADARIGTLAEAVSASSGPDQPGDSTIRRELLRRLYLSPEEPAGTVDLNSIFAGKTGSAEGMAAVISDLQWIAERQSEALQLERVRWAEGEIREQDAVPLTVSEEIIEAQSVLGEMGARMAQMDNTVRRLEAGIFRRDAIISDLKGVPLHEAREIAKEETS